MGVTGAVARTALVLSLVATACTGKSSPTTSLTATVPSVSDGPETVFVPPPRTVDAITHVELTLLDGTHLTLGYPDDLDLTSAGVEVQTVGSLKGEHSRVFGARHRTPESFIAATEEHAGPGELAASYPGVDGSVVERWEFPDQPIAYLVYDFGAWTVFVWDGMGDADAPMGEAAERLWAENLHGEIDSNRFLVLRADSPLELVEAADDPGPDGPDIRIDGSSGGLLIFINDCDRMTRLDQESYGQEVFAFCDEPTNTLFFVGGDAEVQERVHTSLQVNPVTTSTTVPATTTTLTGAEGLGQWIRVDDTDGGFGGEGDQVVSGIAAGPSGFVAVGEDERSSSSGDDEAAVWTSATGAQWSRVPSDAGFVDSAMTDVVWFPDGELFVAVGHHVSEGAVWLSGDGEVWERVTLLGFENAGGGIEVDAVTVGGQGLMAVGREWLSEGASVPAVWLSSNGRQWDRAGDLGQFGDRAAMIDVVQHGDSIYTIGYVDETEPAIWVSTDAINWQLVALDLQISGVVVLTSIASDQTMLAVTGSSDAENVDARVWTSTDGQTWRGRQQDLLRVGIPFLDDVLITSHGWIAVGRDSTTYRPSVGAAVWSSVGGRVWRRYPPETTALSPDPAGVAMTAAVFGNGVVVAGGITGDACVEWFAQCDLDVTFWVWEP